MQYKAVGESLSTPVDVIVHAVGVSLSILRSVMVDIAECHGRYCGASLSIRWGVTVDTVGYHCQYCGASLSIRWGVTVDTMQSFTASQVTNIIA